LTHSIVCKGKEQETKYDKGMITEGGIKMKKTLLIILALILVLGFTAGCGNNNDVDADDGGGAAVIADNDADYDDESLRSSAGFIADALISGMANVSLEDMNIIDPDDDEEGSFRAGMGISPDDLVLASER